MLKDLNKINEEISRLSEELGRSRKVFEQKDLQEAQTYLMGLRAEVRDLSSELDYVSKSFKDSVAELSKQNYHLTLAKSSLKGIASISDKILEYRKGDSSLSIKQLETLQKQAQSKLKELNHLKTAANLSNTQRKEIKEALESQEAFTDEIDRTVRYSKQVNKEIGLVGQGIGGFSKLLSKAGFGDMSKPLQDAINKTKNARLNQKLNADEIKNINKLQEFQNKGYKKLSFEEKNLYSQLKKRYGTDKDALETKKNDLKAVNKELDSQTSKYKNIGKALTDQLTSFNLIDFVFTSLIKGFLTADKSTGELAKNMSITYSEANAMRQDFADIANSSMNANISVQALQESQMAVNKALGSNAQLNDHDLETMTNIVKATGLQHDELMGIQKLSLVNGKSLEDNTKEALGGAKAYAMKNKLVLNEKELLKEVNKASASLKLSLGGSTEALGEAAAKAKQFGINLEQAEDMASKLLDFESSIQSELEAELITGKDLNLEKARGLALDGKSADAAAEMLKQVGSAAEFGDMGVIAQEAMAKAVGMTREQLAQSLIEQESLAKLSEVEGKTMQEKYESMKAMGMSEAEIREKIGNDELARQLEQQSNQEKFNNAVVKLQEIFAQVMDALMPIFEILTDIVVAVLPALNLAFEPIRLVLGAIGESFKYMRDLIVENADVAAVFATVMGGILLTQQIIAATKKEGWLYSTYEYAMSKKKLIMENLTSAKKKISASIEKRGLIMTIAKAAMGAYSAMTSIPIVGPILGAAAAAAAVAYGYSLIKGNDIMSPGQGSSGYGKRTLLGPEGAISLNNKDTVIAGTNLFGNDVKSEAGKPTEMSGEGTIKVEAKKESGGAPKIDMSQTNSLLRELISVISAGGDVIMDGQKVGQALKLATRDVQ